MRALSTLTAMLVLLSAVSCQRGKELMFRKSSVVMYTTVTITVISDSEDRAERAIDAAFDEIRGLEKLLSFWTEDSEIALINKSAGAGPVHVSGITLEIASRSLYIARKTGGAFDPTIGPVIKLWDFREQRLPDEDSLNKALKLVDYSMVLVDDRESSVYLSKAGMSFDTGGIAKGFAADRAVSVLKANGIKAGLVSVAGDIKAFGLKPTRKGSSASANGQRYSPWRIGIRNPDSEDKDAIMATIALTDEAVSTSGDYERYFELEGARYHHLLDPKTGYPARGCRSVTVVAKDAVLTDGFATGVFVLGPEEGLRLLEDEPSLEGIIITTDGRRLVTEGLKQRVKWEIPARPGAVFNASGH